MSQAERIYMHYKISPETIEMLKWTILETFKIIDEKFKIWTTGHGRTLKMNDLNWFRWFPSMPYHAI